MTRTKRTFTFCTLEKIDILRGLPKETKPNLQFHLGRLVKVHQSRQRELEHFRQDPEALYPFSSTSKAFGPGVPSPRRERKDRLILEGQSVSERSQHRLEPATNASRTCYEGRIVRRTRVRASPKSKRNRGRRRTFDRDPRRLAARLRPQTRIRPKQGRPLPTTNPSAGFDQRRSIKVSCPRFCIRPKTGSIAEDFSVYESLHCTSVVLTSLNPVPIYCQKHQYKR